jgi:hypothetical protein
VAGSLNATKGCRCGSLDSIGVPGSCNELLLVPIPEGCDRMFPKWRAGASAIRCASAPSPLPDTVRTVSFGGTLWDIATPLSVF